MKLLLLFILLVIPLNPLRFDCGNASKWTWNTKIRITTWDFLFQINLSLLCIVISFTVRKLLPVHIAVCWRLYVSKNKWMKSKSLFLSPLVAPINNYILKSLHSLISLYKYFSSKWPWLKCPNNCFISLLLLLYI